LEVGYGRNVLKQYNLVYIEKENVKECLGCIAKAATRAKDDIKANVERKGKKIHKQLVSKRGPTIRDKSADYKRNRKPKGCDFRPSYIRKKWNLFRKR
jgi:hypothetical protein